MNSVPPRIEVFYQVATNFRTCLAGVTLTAVVTLEQNEISLEQSIYDIIEPFYKVVMSRRITRATTRITTEAEYTSFAN